jgi:hypothetical protein
MPLGRRDEEAHAIAFHHLDRRPGRLAVVAPEVRLHAGGNLALHGFRDQVKLLDAVPHAPGQRPAVQRGHGPVRPAVRRMQRAAHAGAVGRDDVGQRSEGRAARGGGGYGEAAAEEMSSGDHEILAP